MANDIGAQLGEIFNAGLDSRPDLKAAILASLSSEDEMVTKGEANYRHSQSDVEKCANCDMFQPKKNRCDIVSGRINPGDVCDYYQGREDPNEGEVDYAG